MTNTTLQPLEGRQVSLALRDGTRFDDCQLVSAGRGTTATVWLFTNGDDVFVSFDDVLDAWEPAPASRAA